MLTKRVCFLCGDVIPESDRNREHIVPNAIGGRLQSEGILCNRDNKALGRAVDVPFAKIFEPFSARLGLKTDRDIKTFVEGYHPESKQKVRVEASGVTPERLYYDEENRVLFAPTRQLEEQYRRRFPHNGVEWEEVRVVRTFEGWTEVQFTLDNRAFRLGLAKCAAGFATFHGVDRQWLGGAVDVVGNVLVDPPRVVPAILDDGINLRLRMRDAAFPVHWLRIVGDPERRMLRCYVELFSTFRFWVFLNDEYDGACVDAEYVIDLATAGACTSVELLGNIEEPLRALATPTPPSEEEVITQLTTGLDELRLLNKTLFDRLTGWMMDRNSSVFNWWTGSRTENDGNEGD
jgi:hypothetical protein